MNKEYQEISENEVVVSNEFGNLKIRENNPNLKTELEAENKVGYIEYLEKLLNDENGEITKNNLRKKNSKKTALTISLLSLGVCTIGTPLLGIIFQINNIDIIDLIKIGGMVGTVASGTFASLPILEFYEATKKESKLKLAKLVLEKELETAKEDLEKIKTKNNDSTKKEILINNKQSGIIDEKDLYVVESVLAFIEENDIKPAKMKELIESNEIVKLLTGWGFKKEAIEMIKKYYQERIDNNECENNKILIKK